MGAPAWQVQVERGKRISDAMFAAADGNEIGIREFFESEAGQHASVDDVDYEGKTLLMVAASHGHLAAVRYLLGTKASPNMMDRAGQTVLAVALKHGHEDVCRAIHAAGGQLGWDDNTTSSHLCELARAGNVDQLKLVLSLGANVNVADCMLGARSKAGRPIAWLDDFGGGYVDA